jgi:CRISPR system Cascade subunit CasE
VFLSTIAYDKSHRNALEGLSDCHQMHRTVMSAFPDIQDDCEYARAKHKITFRMEEDHILVQSKPLPNGARLKAGYLIVGIKDIAPIYASIQTGMELEFKVYANPSKKNYFMTGKREGLTRLDDQIRWLARRGEFGGFTINEDVRVVPGRVGGNNPDGRITLVSASFEGHLRVSDADIFRQTLEKGLGGGKSYGLGLMTVRLSG